MALLVLCEPAYKNSAYCDIKIRGITDEASRRRIQPEFYVDLNEFDRAAGKYGRDSSVILLFDSLVYLRAAIEVILRHDLHLILSANQIDLDIPCAFSMVGSDNDFAMRTMLDYLKRCGKKKIALVAVNPYSSNDCMRAKMLARYADERAHRVFYIEKTSGECFDEFVAVQNEFDAAICTNDLSAVCLSERLKSCERRGEKLFILSYTDTVLARVYGEGITSMTTEFYKCGRDLVSMHFNRKKYGFESSRTLIPTEIKVRGSTDNIPYRPSGSLPRPILPPTDGAAPPAPQLSSIRMTPGEAGKIERVLSASDLVDLKLIFCLVCDYSYERMSEFCFVSGDTAKYRIRKIKQILKVSSKADAAEMLRTYIKKESILSLIGEQEQKNNRIIV